MTERVYDLGATAKKNLDDQFPTLMVRAAARGALKYGAAQGIGHGVRSSMEGNEGQNNESDFSLAPLRP